MPQVKGDYPDHNERTWKNYFFLDADQAFISEEWNAPIQWAGTVGGIKVKFTQIESHALNNDSYNWHEFPKELESAKSYIVKAIVKAKAKAIEKAMKTEE